jgi:MraZ protein
VFRGIHRIALDGKGRLSVPAAYRQRLLDTVGGQLVLTVDRDGCLLLYPVDVWEGIERKLIELSSLNKRARALKRLMIGHAEECQLDTAGRILVPGPLRDFANLEKQIVLVGQGNKFEIWSEQAWQAWCEAELANESDDETTPDLAVLAF